MDIRHLDRLPYTDVMPDGRRVTFDDIQPDWWVQIFVGAWPYNTECGYVTAVHGGGVTVALRRERHPVFIPMRRLASTLRPVAD
ncbi:hypothetical protein [Streptomyces tendae]|uniref:hypothetical protein n=1 Tax=Streptomyces tendae TaxID=1932 RepID=UPI003D735C28